jgi:hypothetical protein
VATIDEGVMTTTLAPIASSVGCIGEPTREMYSAKWAVSARADIGGLPGSGLRRVTEYVRQNLDKALTVSELAAVVCMSRYHFARLFKGSTKVVDPVSDPPREQTVTSRICCAATPGGHRQTDRTPFFNQNMTARSRRQRPTALTSPQGTSRGNISRSPCGAVEVRDV